MNGIEQATDRNVIKSISSSKFENRKVKSIFEIKTHLIRYGDDFLIITNSNKYFELYIKNVKFFLEIRGLKINEDKTKIVAMDNNSSVSSFNFLGYTFYKYRSPHHSNIFTRWNQIRNNKVVTVVQRDNIILFRRKISKLIKDNQNRSAYELIKILNPVIHGWANYYRLGNCAGIFAMIDSYIFRRVQHWLKRKYNKKISLHKLNLIYYITNTQEPNIKAKKYFKDHIEKYSKKTSRKVNQSKIKNKAFKMIIGTENFVTSPVKRAWHFHGYYGEKINWLNFLLLLHKRTPVIVTVLPPKARECNPYINDRPHKDYVFKIVKSRSREDSVFDKLWIRQKGRCEQCNHLIKWSYLSTVGYSATEIVDTHEIHHILPKAAGGTNDLKNLSLLHKKCHVDLHSKQGYLKQTELLYKTK